MRRYGSQSLVTRMRATRRVLLGVLAVSMTLPAFAVASHRKPPKAPAPRLPVCSALSRGAIAKTLGFAPLVLEKRIGPTCAFSAEMPGQYLQALSLQIIPGSNGVFSLAESDALESADREHAEFGVVHKGLFFVYGTMESTRLPPCGSEEAPKPTPPETRTGPICAGEPALTHINVIGYGRSPSGLKPMVTAAAVAESGYDHLPNVIDLVEDIISGKIH